MAEELNYYSRPGVATELKKAQALKKKTVNKKSGPEFKALQTKERVIIQMAVKKNRI